MKGQEQAILDEGTEPAEDPDVGPLNPEGVYGTPPPTTTAMPPSLPDVRAPATWFYQQHTSGVVDATLVSRPDSDGFGLDICN